MNQEIKLSFLLCTLNREDDFKRSIKSLFENDNKGISFEVVVVDQGLSDNVLEVCKLHGAIYIPTDSRGLSLARNIGLKRCNGTFIALMDDDAYISDSYFKDFLSIIENKKYFPNDVLINSIPEEFHSILEKRPTDKNKNRTLLEKHIFDFTARKLFT